LTELCHLLTTILLVQYVSTVCCSDKVFVSGRISYSQYKDRNEATQRSASIIAGMSAVLYWPCKVT